MVVGESLLLLLIIKCLFKVSRTIIIEMLSQHAAHCTCAIACGWERAGTIVPSPPRYCRRCQVWHLKVPKKLSSPRWKRSYNPSSNFQQMLPHKSEYMVFIFSGRVLAYLSYPLSIISDHDFWISFNGELLIECNGHLQSY